MVAAICGSESKCLWLHPAFFKQYVNISMFLLFVHFRAIFHCQNECPFVILTVCNRKEEMHCNKKVGDCPYIYSSQIGVFEDNSIIWHFQNFARSYYTS